MSRVRDTSQALNELKRTVAGLPKDESAIETDADSYGDEHFEDD